MKLRFDIIKRSDCPIEFIDLATKDKDKDLSKRASKVDFIGEND